MGAGQTALELNGVACLRGDRLLFEGLNLALGAGEAALVTGPNGVGKSSLLRMIAGLLAPSAGSVRAEGGIALAAEQAALDENKPLGNALTFWARLDACPHPSATLARRSLPLPAGRGKGPADEVGGKGEGMLTHAMAAMGIAHLAEVPVRMLSTGQRKRAVLARTIASGAGVWLLDEPGNGLDDSAIEALGTAIAQHRATGGIVLVASHQPIPFEPTQRIAL